MSLSVEHLSVFLPDGSEVVKDISFSVNRGETVALVGASGSGKSVTVSAIFDLLARGLSVTGDITLEGQPFNGHRDRGKRIACIMQNPASAFNPVYTMRQHAEETQKAVGLQVDNDLIIKAMEDAGLTEIERVLRLYPFQMSGGMLQRMMLALALMSQADFLVADEPTTDLDLIVQSHILQQLERIAHERSLGLLLVTHDLGVVAKLADRVVVMSQGELVESCDVMALFDKPTSSAAIQLLDAHYSMYGQSMYGQTQNAEVTDAPKSPLSSAIKEQQNKELSGV